MIRPALTETIAAMSRALRSAQIEPPTLRSILLVGGSSRIPLVSEMLTPGVLRPHRAGHPPQARRRPGLGPRRSGGRRVNAPRPGHRRILSPEPVDRASRPPMTPQPPDRRGSDRPEPTAAVFDAGSDRGSASTPARAVRPRPARRAGWPAARARPAARRRSSRPPPRWRPAAAAGTVGADAATPGGDRRRHRRPTEPTAETGAGPPAACSGSSPWWWPPSSSASASAWSSPCGTATTATADPPVTSAPPASPTSHAGGLHATPTPSPDAGPGGIAAQSADPLGDEVLVWPPGPRRQLRHRPARPARPARRPR